MNKLRMAAGFVGLAGLTVCVPMLVHAGRANTQQVWHYNILGTTGTIGSLKASRYSADGAQWIGCSTSKYYTGQVNGSCVGADSTSRYFTCSTTDPQMIAIMQSASSASQITFSYVDGNCTSVSVSNDSMNL
jgi:hypothetical protein